MFSKPRPRITRPFFDAPPTVFNQTVSDSIDIRTAVALEYGTNHACGSAQFLNGENGVVQNGCLLSVRAECRPANASPTKVRL